MTFEEDAMEAAYKSLESTGKFCDTSRKFSELFSSSSNSQRFSRHQRLYRKSIVADCLLFQAIIVFIRQNLTSYVKGGYLIRKACKMYEKIYNETELLCSHPSPISRPGVSSPTDRHVGTSVYDEKNAYLAEEGEEEVVEEEEVKKTIAELGDTFAMQLGLGGGASETAGEGEREGGEGVQNGSVHSSYSPHSQSDSAVLKEGTGLYRIVHELYCCFRLISELYTTGRNNVLSYANYNKSVEETFVSFVCVHIFLLAGSVWSNHLELTRNL